MLKAVREGVNHFLQLTVLLNPGVSLWQRVGFRPDSPTELQLSLGRMGWGSLPAALSGQLTAASLLLTPCQLPHSFFNDCK